MVSDMERMPEDVQALVAQERAWREGYYTGKRDYAGSVTGGAPISTPNPYTEQLEAAYSQKGADARIAEAAYPLGSFVAGDAPSRIAAAIRKGVQ